MVLVTDRFHGEQAHDSCPSSFKMNYWKSIVEARKWLESHDVNTSAAEQLNAKLHNLGKHVHCAKLSNAIEWTKKFCEIHNMVQTGVISKEYKEHT